MKVRDLVLRALEEKRAIHTNELKKIGTYSSIKTYITHLRREGHKIKYVNKVYYYGGRRVKSYTEELLC
jgi:hypothetical protein